VVDSQGREPPLVERIQNQDSAPAGRGFDAVESQGRFPPLAVNRGHSVAEEMTPAGYPRFRSGK
jgi:hypothetical protein